MKRYGDYKFIIYEKEGSIARITMNHPKGINILEYPRPGKEGLVRDITSALERALWDADIKCVVIRGNERGFSGGHDLNEAGFVYGMGTNKNDERPSQATRAILDRQIQNFHYYLASYPKYLIGQVHGHAVGEGFHILAYFDIVLAAEDAVVGDAYQRMAGSAGGILYNPFFMAHVGMRKWVYLSSTGEYVSGKEAAEIGLVSRAVPREKLEEETMKIAGRIGRLAADPLVLGKIDRIAIYEAMGLMHGIRMFWSSHAWFTNSKFREGETSFFRERRNQKGSIAQTVRIREKALGLPVGAPGTLE